MANTHGIPDVANEVQALFQDLLPPCIISSTFPAVPGSGMVLAAFATQGFVFDGEQSVYVDQPAISVTLTGSAGNFWLALHRDVSSAVAGWTRRPGSHYLWQTNATQPATPAGALVFCQVVVTATNITAVTPLAGARNPMSKQMSSAVAITGGTAAGLTILHAAECQIDGNTLMVDGPTSRVGIGMFSPEHLLDVNGDARLRALTGFGAAPIFNSRVSLWFAKQSQLGLTIRPSDNDTGPFSPVYFGNQAGTQIGSISSSGVAVAYNTTSDARLKEFVQTLVGALDVIRALNPVSFHWQADGSKGNGFLAHELMKTIPEAVSGLPDEVNLDGTIKPQQVDHSRLVVWLVAAVQELAARVQSLEEQLGI